MDDQQEEVDLKCYDCGKPADPTLLGYYQTCADCYAGYVKELKQYKASRTTFTPEINQILPNLFLGNEDAAINEKLLDTHNIHGIMVCGNHLDSPFEHKFAYKKFLIADDPKQNIIGLFPQAYEWIESHMNEGKNVFVHCAAGISRSASFVIAYLMRKNKMKLQEAREFVKAKRPIIHPNPGFVATLQKYEKLLQESQ